MQKPQAKSHIYQIAPYKQGKSSTDPNVVPIKLSSNENPYGASPKAIEAYQNHARLIHRYPEGSSRALREQLAAIYEIEAQRIVCGAGSDELIALLINAYAGVGDEVIFTEHAFLMYKVYTLSAGATPIEVGEVGLKASIDNIVNAITPQTKIIFIANPNNPTGSYLSLAELQELHTKIPPHIVLAIDGAYAECANAPDYSSGLELARMHDNVIMLRTFSKIYGLPNLRLGWAYGTADIIEAINRIKSPFNVNGAAQMAGIATLQDSEWVQWQQQHNATSRALLTNELQNMELKVYPSQGNFILVEFDDAKHAKSVASALEAKHIYVREVGAYKLPTCLRISMGTQEENQMFLENMQIIITGLDL
jgi:histidinol-phosphate aminotransferase